MACIEDMQMMHIKVYLFSFCCLNCLKPDKHVLSQTWQDKLDDQEFRYFTFHPT